MSMVQADTPDHGAEPEWPKDFAVDVPPQFAALARQYIAGGHEHLVPPLLPEDIVFLVGTSLAAKLLYPLAPHKEGEPPPFAHYVLLDVLGVMLTVWADPDYAGRAGFVYTPNRAAMNGQALRKLHEWREDVLDPALGGPWCKTPDLSPRGRVLKKQHSDYFRIFFRPNFAKTLEALEQAVIDNVGGNERNPRDREKLPKEKEIVLGWFKLVAESSGLLATTMQVEGGEMSLHPSRAKQALDEALGEPRRLGEETSLEEPTIHGSELGSLLTTQCPGVLDLAAIAELRDLRDQLDLMHRHPQLDALIEDDMRRGRSFGDMTTWIRKIVDRLDRIEDRALCAAVVYEIGGVGQEGHPRWTRAEVGGHYGATAREMEGRQGLAQEIAAQLVAG